MTEVSGDFGIDDPITLRGHQTTLREEYQQGNVALVRGNMDRHLGSGRWYIGR
jgi:hypothetical protein